MSRDTPLVQFIPLRPARSEVRDMQDEFDHG